MLSQMVVAVAAEVGEERQRRRRREMPQKARISGTACWRNACCLTCAYCTKFTLECKDACTYASSRSLSSARTLQAITTLPLPPYALTQGHLPKTPTPPYLQHHDRRRSGSRCALRSTWAGDLRAHGEMLGSYWMRATT